MKRGKLILYAALLIAGIISLFFDQTISSNLHNIQNMGLERIFYTFSNVICLALISSAIIIGMLIEKKKVQLIKIFLAGTFGFLTSHLMKLMFQRPRPMGFEKELFLLKLPDYSFPSSHAVVVFAILPIIMTAYPKYKWFFITFACLIAFSRFYLGLHYLSDVIFGSLIGLLISDFLLNVQDLSKHHHHVFNIIRK